MNVFKSDFRIILELYLNNIFMLRYLYEQISKIDYMASLQNFRSPLEHTLSLGQFSVVLLHTNFVSYLLVRLLVTCSCGSRVPQNDQVGIFVWCRRYTSISDGKSGPISKKNPEFEWLNVTSFRSASYKYPNLVFLGYPIAEGLLVHIAYISGINYDYE